MKCLIYRCSRKQEMYLYLPYQDDESAVLQGLDENLLKLTGKLEKVMELDLTSDRKLARADVSEVKQSLIEKSYYIQMPPNDLLTKDESMLHNPSDSF